DTVATTEIRYGDNDRLAARVAAMASCDALVLLSDIDGLYSAPPASDPDARHLSVVENVTAEIEAMAGDAGSALSRGGMRTKIEAAKIALGAGCAMVIASGRVERPLQALRSGARSTWFPATASPRAAWRSWIAGQVAPQGAIVIDAGAVAALKRGKSLLPAGVRHIEGGFKRGDAVTIRAEDGAEIGRGLVAYDAPEARAILGLRTEDIAERLGYEGRAAMIHRDDMALLGP
ncbi:MAG: glutamate 5-kinase, partial [Pseudomonadota bacterium]